MDDIHLAETVNIKECIACKGGMLESDQFCRWCGTRQTQPEAKPRSRNFNALNSSRLSKEPTSPYATAALQEVKTEASLYHSVSGPLVKAVIAGVSASTSKQHYSQVVRRTVLALVSIPIWMIIVMLSPLDAYAAAKAISRDI